MSQLRDLECWICLSISVLDVGKFGNNNKNKELHLYVIVIFVHK